MDAEPKRLSLCYEKTVFPSIFSPSIDLFASKRNIKLPKFISYRLDTESKAENAFIQSWTDLKFHVFPPFICLPGVIQKIWQDEAEGILVVPDRANQLWHSQLCNIITKDVLLFAEVFGFLLRCRGDQMLF